MTNSGVRRRALMIPERSHAKADHLCRYWPGHVKRFYGSREVYEIYKKKKLNKKCAVEAFAFRSVLVARMSSDVLITSRSGQHPAHPVVSIDCTYKYNRRQFLINYASCNRPFKPVKCMKVQSIFTGCTVYDNSVVLPGLSPQALNRS